MATFVAATIDAASWRAAEALMAQLPVEMHHEIMPRVVRRAIRPVVDRARQLARLHDSSITGTAAKQSAATRASRVGTIHLWESITHRVRTYNDWSTLAIAGPSWPAGNLINFWASDKQHYLWGRAYYGILPAMDFLIRAAEDTRTVQSMILVSELQREVNAWIATHAPFTVPGGTAPTFLFGG